MAESTAPRRRCEYQTDRAQRVLEFCQEPKSMNDIVTAFGAEQARFAVYNLVKRKRMVNLNAGSGHGVPGLFVATANAASSRSVVTSRSDGSALARAWHQQGRSLQECAS